MVKIKRMILMVMVLIMYLPFLVLSSAKGATWTIKTLDDHTRENTSIAIDSSGHVHISYQRYTTLKYATNATGSWITETVETLTPGNYPLYASIAIDSLGHAHISYYDYANGLKYATNASGSWETVMVEPSGYGGVTSIALGSSDKVHISYCADPNDDSYYDLKYATNALGYWVTDTVENSIVYQGLWDTSIALDSSDKVHISYCADPDYDYQWDLKYATHASASWATQTVDNGNQVGMYASIALDSSGYVHISHHGFPDGLKYTTNALGFWATQIVDSGLNVGKYTSVALDSSDYVHISYYDGSNGHLKYATSASGTWVSETVDTSGDVGKFSSIALDSSDYVHISYTDETNDYLKYATNVRGGFSDFDGDGKADVGIYRSSTGAWWIIPSSTGSGYGVGWGGTGYIPVPGDYDGDGKADVAIYGQSTGAWWIIPSSTGSAYGIGWGCLLYTSPSPRDQRGSRMPSSA